MRSKNTQFLLNSVVFAFAFGLIIVSVWPANAFALAQRTPRGVSPSADQIVINEFLASNDFGLADEDGDSSDWIELFNAGDSAVDLSGWSLTDDVAEPSQWLFPNRIIESHAYLLVIASGKDRRSDDPAQELHTNFKLSAGGEYLALFAPDDLNQPVDSYSPEYPQQYTDVSYGRYQVTQYRYFANPTPGAANDETGAYEGVTAGVDFSIQRGFFDEAFTVELSSETPDAIIRYTTNSDAPSDTAGDVYGAPITIAQTTVLRAIAAVPGFLPSPVNTNTYIFPAQVAHQPANPAGFPMTWGWYNNQQTPADYEMDPSISFHPDYIDTIGDDLQTLPVLSIVTSRADMFGTNGIYAYPLKHGRDWERPASMELFSTDDHGFQINAGVRIHGGTSRYPDKSGKHSFRLYFRGDYGPAQLEQAIFPDTHIESFDKLVVRANFADSWVWGTVSPLLLRDQWTRDTENDMGKLNSHGIFVDLYVDGLYWGVYNLIERIDDDYVVAYLGGSKDDYDVLKRVGKTAGFEVKAGDMEAWNAMIELANQGLDSAEQYAAIQQYLDIPTFIDYMIINLYAGHHHEWPLQNLYAIRPRAEGGQFIFLSWDTEAIFYDVHEDVTDISSYDTPAWLYAKLRDNPEFRLHFADRLHKHLFNGGALYVNPDQPDWDPDYPENNVPAARLMKRAQKIDRAMVGESARWGDWKGTDLYTRNDDWAVELERLLLHYFPQRSAIVLQQFRDRDLYPAIVAPSYSQHGGVVDEGFTLAIEAPEGIIYYTTDGADPRLPESGEPSPSAMMYQDPVAFTSGATTVKARVLVGGDWSALNEAVFEVTPTFEDLHITEIMYNPLDGSDYEFIELHNASSNDLDLGGVAFVDGIDFAFSAGITLSAGEYAVLVKDAGAFSERYPGVGVAGSYDGKLSNGGEQLVLHDSQGNVIIDMTYDDGGLWPSTADGLGHSLVLYDESRDPNDPGAWRASREIHGSPGEADPAPVFSGVVINELLAHTDPPYEDAIELYNPLDQDFDIGGWFLSDDAATPKKFRIPDGVVIPAGDYKVFYEYEFNPNPGIPPSFALSSHGEQLILSAADLVGDLTGYTEAVEFGATPTNTAIGRYETSIGSDFALLESPTFGVENPDTVEAFRLGLGAANVDPVIGPVVINELMYHPADGGDEFIELYNTSAAAVMLYDPDNPENAWAFIDGVSYTFPSGVTMPARSFLLIVKIDPEEFRAKYDLSDSVPIYGPYDGKLSNGGERVALARPDQPDGEEIPFIAVDVVAYDDSAPWPVAPDGDGPSLARLSPEHYGNDPANWSSSVEIGGSPGRRNGSDPLYLPVFLPVVLR